MSLKVNRVLLLIALGFLTVTLSVVGGEVVGGKNAGKWRAGSFAQENVSCTQAWICTPGVDVMHAPETTVVTSENDWTQGICNANGGAIDSCNACSASQPKKPCQYWLEKK